MPLNQPAEMHTEHVPEIPDELSDRVRQYMLARSAFFCDWNPDGQGVLMSTRFSNTYQLHTLASPGAARQQLTFYNEPLYSARYRPHSDTQSERSGILFSMDTGGAEYYQIYYTDLKTGLRQCLTDGKSKNGSPLWSPDGEKVAFSSTLRNGRDHDIYVKHIDSARDAELVCRVQGMWVPMAWSPDGQKLMLMDYLAATETYYHLLDLETGEVTALFTDRGKVAYGSVCFDTTGEGMYFVADFDSQFQQLHHFHFASEKLTSITTDIPWNVTVVRKSYDGQQLLMGVNEDGMSKLYLLNTETNAYEALELPTGVIGNPRFSPDNKQIAFSLHRPNHPADIYSMTLDSRELTRWTHTEVGGLNTEDFPVPDLIRYPSFDDREIPAFYYKPRQKSDRPYPVIIHIHGGPESQYRPTYSALFQYWLNELDIAVLAPNVRGSSGYGKKYIEMDNGYLREDSVKDIGALLDWIKAHPELDEKRVCVYGGSYGGYMVLAALTHYSDRLRCGIEIVGISHFVTFLKNTKSYRRNLRRVEYGDERDPDMAAFLHDISPKTNAHKIKRPLMVAQGLNDPRVPASEAEQIVETVRKNEQEVWYLLANNEGHGFHKLVNLHYYYSAISLFLEEFLLD